MHKLECFLAKIVSCKNTTEKKVVTASMHLQDNTTTVTYAAG
jgi:hypothetical protein